MRTEDNGRPARGSAFAWAALVAIGALASHAWVLGLPFKLDDVTQIPLAEDLLRDELGMATAEPVTDSFKSRFRPVLWASFALEKRLSGTPASSLLFHGTSLAVHVACALALFLVLLRSLGPGAAAAAASFFAAHPGGSQAVSWIAARSDMLVTLFALVSLGCVSRPRARGGRLLLVLGGLSLGAALMSKISAYVLPPLYVPFLWRLAPNVRGRLRVAAVFYVPILAVAAWRQLYLGTWLPTYPSGAASAGNPIERYIDLIPAILAHLAVPWNLSVEVVEYAPWLARWLEGARDLRASVAYGFVAVPAVALACRLRWSAPRILGALAASFILAAPISFLFAPTDGHVMGRVFYPLMVPFAFVFGVAVRAASERRWTKRFVLVPLLGAVGFMVADALVNTAACELAVGRRLDRQLSGIREHLRDLPPRASVAVVGPRTFWAGSVMIGSPVGRMFAPPFASSVARVSHFFAFDDLVDSRLLELHREPVRVLVWAEGRMRSEGPLLGALPNQLPRLSWDDAGRGWRPEETVPSRAVSGLLVLRPAGNRAPLEVHVETERGRVSLTAPAPVGAATVATTVLFTKDRAWLTGGALRSVRYEGPAPESLRGWPAPGLLADVPEVRLLGPENGVTWRPGDDLQFRFEDDGGRFFRLQLRLDVPDQPSLVVSYAFPRSAAAAGESAPLAYVPHEDHQETKLTLSAIPVLFARYAAQIGLTHVRVRWSIEVLDAAGGRARAKSDWWALTYRPR